MFTGLIQAVGSVASLRRKGTGARLLVRAAFEGLEDPLVLGESVAVDGACLTVAELSRGGFHADLSRETLARTTAGSWKPGRRVNLERALRPTDRLGGHLVQGHVDARGKVVWLKKKGGQVLLRVVYPPDLSRLIAEKGSIAVDGVSLTVSGLGSDWLEASLVPHTLDATNLADRRGGDPVNLEADMIARYLDRLLGDGGGVASSRRKVGRRTSLGHNDEGDGIHGHHRTSRR